jgi:endogenous inhibitor of DNA gyrase (YacG/DUF329 family)
MMVRCPHCGNPAEYKPENSFRPFCSERCKLIDLGQWADESYRVPVEKEEASTDFVPETDGDHENEGE